MEKPTLQLSGQDGNAMFIIGRACRAAKDAGWDKSQIDKFCDEAMSCDYDNVLQTCMKYFDVS